MEKEYCGIDFGTTNTTLVFFSEKYGKKFVGDKGNFIGQPLPSIIALNNTDNKVYVGHQVKQNIKQLSETCNIVSSIKTVLDDEILYWKFSGKENSPIDIAAYIFHSLQQNAKEQGIEVKKAVVSVPINFPATKKQCLKKAAKIAGIEITKFVSEPTAAYLAHYEELKSFNNIVVFDWGGGTLDISALSVEHNTVKEIYTDNMYKAGDDIDRNFAKHLYKKMIQTYGLSLVAFHELPSCEYDELLSKVERCKIKLSQDGVNSVKDICTIQGRLIEFTATYQDLCIVIHDVVQEAIKLLTDVVAQSFQNSIDCILCVGGSSNLRYLRESLQKIFNTKLYFPDEPQWDIADGACTIDASNCKNIYTLPYDISLKLSDGHYLPLLQKGDLLPCKSSIINVSTTDSSSFANFIFRIGDHNEYQEIIPVLGGLDETLTIETFIDEYLILHINMKNNKTQEEYNIFNYEKLEVCYNI